MGESIAILGTPFRLFYFSDRVPGRISDFSVSSPLQETNATGTSSVTGVRIEVKYGSTVVASKSYSSLTTGQKVTFAVDSSLLNPRGPSNVAITKFLSTTFSATDANSWQTIVGIAASMSGYYPQPPFNTSLGNYRPKFLGLGGWTISSLHFYSKDAETTYFGYGGSKKAPAQTLTIAGDSVDYYSVGSENKSEIYLFDKISGLHRKTVNPRTGATLLTFSYDSGDRILKIEDAFGSQTKFQRNSSGVLLNVLAAKRQQTVTTFDSNGYLSAVTNPSSGQTYSMAYKQSGLLQSFKTPGEKIGNFTYDQNGLLISDLSSSGESTVLSASIPYYYPNVAGEGKAMTKKSAAGRSTVVRSQYDTITKDEYSVVVEANDFTRETVTGFRDQVDIIERTPSGLMFNHNISRQQDPWYTTLFNFETAEQFQGGGQSLYKSSEHNVTAGTTSNHKTSSPSIFQFSKDELVTWIDGKAWRNVYLSNSMQETLSSPLSRKVYRNLDRFGRVLSSRWDNYTPVNYIYDNYGRLIGITQGSRNNSIDYDSKGYVSAVTNARSEKVEFIYGPNGELIEMLLPDSRSVRFSYDSDGNRTSITTPSAFTHSFAYSGHGSISQYIPPNLTSSGQPSASYEYDNDGKIKTIKRPNSNLVAFNYSSTTHMLSGITTPEGSHSFSYNGPLITSTTSPDLYRQEYTYSGHLRNSETLMLATMSYGTVEKTFPSYLLGSVKVAGVSQMPIINYIYDNDRLLVKAGVETISRSVGSGQVTATGIGQNSDSYKYTSDFGELASYQLNHNGVSKYGLSFTRDNLGRILTKVETLGSGTNRYEYSYDPTGRLTTVLKNGNAYSNYSYDLNNNRVSGYSAGVSFNSTFNSNDQLVSKGAESFSYSVNGELASRTNIAGTTSYRYDSFGNLKSVITPAKTINYKLDSNGRRVARLNGSSVTNRYLYQDELKVVALLDPSSNVTHQFIYGVHGHVPDYMVKAGVIYRLVSDQVGSVRLVVRTSDGTVAQEITYDDSGKVTSDSSPGFQPFGFAGCLYDVDTQLCHFGAREYDGSTARWLTKDPIGFGGGDTNLYGYVLNDSVNLIDPNGKWSVSTGIYAGFGGGFVFGQNPHGGNFVTFQAGYGTGANIAFDPDGNSGGSAAVCNGSSIEAGVYADASVDFGPFSIGVGGNRGVTISPGVQNLPYDNGSGKRGLGPPSREGYGFGWSVGGEITFK